MKKVCLLVALTCMSMQMMAQQKLTLSTYAGTNLERYDGLQYQVTVNRYVFNGWNTLSLPFDMTASELDEAFGSSCRLERLIGVDNDGTNIVLNFQDCKHVGLKANVPYILYFSGESATKKIAKTATISKEPVELTYTTGNGMTVTMAPAQTKTEPAGLYGVLARDNAEAQFVPTDGVANGFYATRCFIKLSGSNTAPLLSNHLQEGDVTSINAIASTNEKVDVYSLSGARVATGMRAAEVNALQPNIYIVKGHKILVR